MTWEINYYKTQRGRYPAREFIFEQSESIRARINHSITLLNISGPFLKPPYMKKISNKLYELRIVGKEQIRIFYTIYQNKYYLLHGFKKKTQKTPKKEIETALDRMRNII